MSFSAILGAWIAAFLTLGIFSYLYRDNPFYKIAEHVFVGVSAAYVCLLYTSPSPRDRQKTRMPSSA